MPAKTIADVEEHAPRDVSCSPPTRFDRCDAALRVTNDRLSNASHQCVKQAASAMCSDYDQVNILAFRIGDALPRRVCQLPMLNRPR
jgi:hypothetical protein